MKVKVGKYFVEAVADDVGNGQWSGTAHYWWDEGDSSYTSKKMFGEKFASARDAERHALEQFELRVRNDDL